MKKVTLLLIALSLINLNLVAQDAATESKQDTLWKFGGVTSLNFSQLSLSNWAAGGENSIAANALVNLTADYGSEDGMLTWNNELLAGYGLVRQGDDPFRKSDDKIDISSKFGYKTGSNWFYSGLFNFRTQFTEGYSNPGDVNRTIISNSFAPAYMNLSLGMDYKPNKKFTLLVAPVTGKLTIVTDPDLSAAGAFGVQPGETRRGEFGGFVKIAYADKIMKNVKLNAKIDFFSNYIENPQDIDVNLDLLLSFKVNEFISASLIAQALYDRDILFDVLDAGGAVIDTEPRLQLKQLFGIGLTYSF